MRVTLLDYPPVWLAGCLALAWAQARALPVEVPVAVLWAGSLIAGAGLALILAAAIEFTRARTTIVPHRAPAVMITGGPYRLSRNPIYLGDVLILAGLALRWGAWPSLLLVPVLVVVLERRFIRPEEARLEAAFGARYRAWAARVRRWA